MKITVGCVSRTIFGAEDAPYGKTFSEQKNLGTQNSD